MLTESSDLLSLGIRITDHWHKNADNWAKNYSQMGELPMIFGGNHMYIGRSGPNPSIPHCRHLAKAIADTWRKYHDTWRKPETLSLVFPIVP